MGSDVGPKSLDLIVWIKIVWPKRIGCSYSFTVHSCQGMSIDKPYTIYEWERMHKKLKYVALSRATKEEHINVI